MDHEAYKAAREKLQAEAQNLIDAGKIAEANEKMEAIKKLDKDWDETAKAQANMEALKGEQRNICMQDITGNISVGNGIAVEKTAMGAVGESEELTNKSEKYKNAWAKSMMGQKLSQEENECFEMVNEAFTHTTKNTGIIIPESVTKGIWTEVGEIYPYWNDIAKTYVNGTLTMLKEGDSTEAGWYEEDAKTEDGKETFQKMSLSGCELSRAITVSWKLKEMAIEDFIPYIQRKMAEKMGAALGYGATHGKGQPGTGDTFKPEPLGVVTALEKEEGTPQIVEYKKGGLKYTDLTKARGKIKSGYAGGLKIYANSTTIWNELANVQDANGRPILMADVVSGGVYRALSMEVKEDDSMADGEILMSNPQRGYMANVNKEISMTTEDHAKERVTDYCGYAIVDGTMVTSKAHALLKASEATRSAQKSA